jgi:hypothetical protein
MSIWTALSELYEISEEEFREQYADNGTPIAYWIEGSDVGPSCISGVDPDKHYGIDDAARINRRFLRKALSRIAAGKGTGRIGQPFKAALDEVVEVLEDNGLFERDGKDRLVPTPDFDPDGTPLDEFVDDPLQIKTLDAFLSWVFSVSSTNIDFESGDTGGMLCGGSMTVWIVWTEDEKLAEDQIKVKLKEACEIIDKWAAKT